MEIYKSPSQEEGDPQGPPGLSIVVSPQSQTVFKSLSFSGSPPRSRLPPEEHEVKVCGTFGGPDRGVDAMTFSRYGPRILQTILQITGAALTTQNALAQEVLRKIHPLKHDQSFSKSSALGRKMWSKKGNRQR